MAVVIVYTTCCILDDVYMVKQIKLNKIYYYLVYKYIYAKYIYAKYIRKYNIF